MATSGSKSVTVTSWDTLKFSWEVTSQSVANNTSTVAWKMQLIATSSGRINSSASNDWSVTVNGKKYSGTSKVGISNNSTITLASGTTTIEHNSDGTKTFSYSFSQEFAITFSGNYIGTKSGSGSGTLDTIHQKSTLAADNGTLGTAQTLTVTRKSTSLTHTITYKCGSASGTVCTKSSSTSISFTPPLSLAYQNTTGTTVSIVFTITTYSGETNVGSNTKTITCTIPSNVFPSGTLTVTDATPYKTTYGDYLQNMSRFKIDVNAWGNYGATIKSYKITVDGKTYTSASVTTGVISGNGTLKIVVSLTDSRGRSAGIQETVNVVAYSTPKITAISARRCDEAGVSVSNGAFLAVSFDTSITSLSGQNTAAYVLQYKKASDENFTDVPLDDYAGLYSVKGGEYIFAAATDASYDIVLIATDALNTSKRGATGASVSKLFSWLRRGLGFAFGKVAELEGVLDIAFKTRFLGGILPIVLPNGTDFNDVTNTGWYIGNASSGNYLNCPINTGTFTLEVMSAGADGQLYQNLDYCSKTDYKAFRRFFYQAEWGAWIDPNSTIPGDVQADISAVTATANNALSKANTNAGNITTLQTAVNNMLLSVYPVGSIYISASETSPETLFGGTWERIQDKFLLASGSSYSAGSTGGAASASFSIDAHKHSLETYNDVKFVSGAVTSGSYDIPITASTGSAGGASKTISTMPPYLAVYVWKRTA